MMNKLIEKNSLSLEAAKTLVGFAIQKAKELGVGGAIAVVDDGGHLIYFERLDRTMVASANIAIGKAATSIGFKRPGIVLEQTVTLERPAMKSLSGVTQASFVPLKGSYPVEVDGEMVGALAVAGAGTGQNDETIALFAIEKFRNH
jgi:glc operon protein GlcG